jgi:hypothetical protein
MAENNGNGNPTAGGSSISRNNVVQQQNIVIDPAQQNAAAQQAQQILANTNVTLKQEVMKLPKFHCEKGKDTVTAIEFINRIDECQVSNDWSDITTFANFRQCLLGEAEEYLTSMVRHLCLTATQKTRTMIKTLVQKGICHNL